MRLATQLDARLIVLHIIDPAARVSDSTPARDQIARHLNAGGMVTRRGPEIRVRTGNYVQGVVAVARETDADIIVLGGQDAGSAAPAILTTAERIATLAGRPALIVNREPQPQYSALVIAAELSDAFVQVVRVASSLMFLDAERVSIVHHFQVPWGPLRAFDTRVACRNLKAWEEAARARVLNYLAAAGVDSSRFRIIFQPALSIRANRSVIRSVKDGLLIVGPRDCTILPRAVPASLASDALRSLECDILIAAPKVESMTETVSHERATQRIDLKPPGAHRRPAGRSSPND